MSHRNANDSELRQLHEVAGDYRAKGYKVVISPAPEDLPAFLRDFKVDLLARSKQENVVAQVRSRATLAGSTDLAKLAERLEGREGWRLELVVAAGGTDDVDEPRPARTKPLHTEEIQERLAEASELQRRGHDDAAFLIAWTAAEAAMRAALVSAGLPADKPVSLVLVKTLYSYGLITKSDYDLLHRCAAVRNVVAHGFKPARPPSRTAVADLIHFVERLMRIGVRVEA